MSTPDDQQLLAAVDAKLSLIRDRVKSVAQGWNSGFYLWGPGGTSKSFCVENTLRESRTHFKLTNTNISGKGLFELLQEYPSAVHILDDLETMLHDKRSHGVLRSALWAVPGPNGKQLRNVIWQTATKRQEFVFSGGIIMIANSDLDKMPSLAALRTRIPVLNHQMTNEETAALMRKVASAGYICNGVGLCVEHCMEVVDEVVYLSQLLGRNLDMRLLVNGLSDRLMWMEGKLETHWLDLIESRVTQRAPSNPRDPKTGKLNP